jgi:hypothetical protein
MSTIKNKQVEKLKSLLNPEGRSALVILENLGQLQKLQNDEIGAKLKKWRGQLLESILHFLKEPLPERQRAFLSVTVDEEGNRELLELLIGSTLDVDVDSEGDQYVLLGSSSINVTESELAEQGFSFEDCGTLCSEINSIWGEKLATIDSNDSLRDRGLIQFSIDAGSLIHDRA